MRKIINCFGGNLLKISNKIRDIAEFDLRVKKYLPADLVNNCRVINYDNGCLTLGVPNSGWATQLRYQIPELLKVLRTQEQMYALRSIKHQVIEPDNNVRSITIKKKYNFTPNIYQIIYQAALKQDQSALGQALLKLSETVKGFADRE